MFFKNKDKNKNFLLKNWKVLSMVLIEKKEKHVPWDNISFNKDSGDVG